MNTFFTKSTLKPLVLAVASVFGFSLAANAQTFTNNTPEACGHTLYTGSFATTFSRDIVVSGVGNALGANTFLRQINIELGDAGCTRNLTSYSLQLVSPTGTTYNFQSGITSTATAQWINVKFRDNPALERIDQYPVTVQQNYWPYCIGYYKTETDNGFNNFNGQDPNGTWKLRISKTNAASNTGIAFKHVDLVFDNTVLPIRDYTAVTANNACASASCLSNGVSIGTNNGYAANDPLFPGTTVNGCSWNGANNNSSWFYFIANATTASLTLSGIVNTTAAGANDTQPIVLAAPSPDNCTIAPSLVPAGGCPETSTVTTSCYSNSTDPYTNGISSNIQFDLSGLTVGNKYYVYIDGNGGVSSTFYMEMNNAQACACTLTASATQSTAAGCDGITFGSANAVGSNGASPYTYLWDNGSTSQAPANFTAGMHTVTITDNTACTATATCTIGTLTQASTTTMNGGTGPLTVCAGTTINMQTLGSLPAGASVDWYSSTSAGNTPPTNSVLLGNTNATGCSAVCPQMLAIFINACDGAANDEPKNEYIIFSSGGGFNANDFQLKYSNPTAGVNANVNLGVAPCTIQTPTASLIASLQVGLCTPANLIPVAPGSFVPSGANVVFFTSNGVTSSYNFQPLCGAGQTIYVMQSGCTRTSGAFGNGVLPCTPAADAIRTTTLSLANCPTCVDSIAYTRCGIGNTDGEYAIKLPNNVVSSVANGGILIDAGNPCNGPNLSALPVSADTLRFSFATTAANCNTTRYIKGVVNPNTAGCPNYTQEFVLNVVCPAATITKVDATCNLSNGTATADPGTTLPVTYLWSNTATTATISNLAAGTYTVTVTAVGAACASTANVTITQGGIPALTATATNQCNNGAIQFNANTTGATGFAWAGPNSFASSIVNPTIANANSGLHNGTYIVTATFAGGCTRTASVSVNVLNQLNGQITGTTGSVCVGSIISLSATDGNNYAWTGPNGFSYPNTQSPPALNNVTVAMSGVYTVTVTGSNSCSSISTRQITVSPCSSCSDNGCKGPNLVQNADFANNFTNFTSQYLPNNGNATCTPGANCNGQFICQYGYAITNTAPPCNPGWSAGIQDHTPTGNGNFMIVDFPTGIQSNILCTDVVLGANKTYCVGGYFINLLPIGNTTPDPKFQFSVGGVIDPSTFTVDNDEQWQFKGISYTTGATVPATVQICIRNENFGAVGFDVALDDITVREDLSGSAPTAVADAIGVCNGGSVTYNVVGNDTGVFDPATLSISTQAPFSLGTAVANANGTITFTPTVAFTSGSTDFDYRICNAAGTCCANATVTVSSSIVVTTVDTPSSCGLCNGSSTATVTGGTAPYTYTWTNTATGAVVYTGTSNAINTLCGGTYTVSVSDASGTTSVATIFNETFDAANAWTLNVASGTNATNANKWEVNDTEGGVAVGGCGAANNGDKTLHVTCQGPFCLGTGAFYTGTIQTNTRAESPAISTIGQTNMTLAFDYTGRTLNPTDKASVLYSINNGTTWIPLSSNLTAIACAGGQGTWTAFSLPLPAACENIANLKLAFNWTNGTTNGPGLSFAVNNLSIKKTTTTAACTASAAVTIAPSTAPIINMAPASALICAGSSVLLTATPSQAISVGGGFVWNTVPAQTTASITVSPTATTTYTVTVTISAGCTATASRLITVNQVNGLASKNSDASCSLANGVATAVAFPATGAIFLWDNGVATANNNTLTAGTHTVTITVANGCTVTRTVTIADAPAPVINIIQVNTNCGANIGTANASVTAGTATYLWNTGATTSGITGLAAGIYTVTATNAPNCTSSATVEITNQNAPVLTPSQTNATCGLANGTATVNFALGIAATYAWNTSPQQNSQTATGLAAGIYTVTATTTIGTCSVTRSITITNTGIAPTATIAPVPAICEGKIQTLVATTDNITNTFLWNTGAANTAASLPVQPSATTTYTVIITNSDNCTATASQTVTVNPLPTASIPTGTPSTCGLANGSLTATTDNPANTFAWSTSPAQTSNPATNLVAGNYTVTITNNFGCTKESSRIVVIDPTATINIALTGTNPGCTLQNGTITSLLTGATTGGTPTYTWSNTGNTANLSNLDIGTYTVIVSLGTCSTTTSTTLIQTCFVATTTNGFTTCGLNNGTVSVAVLSGAGILWSNGSTDNIVNNLAAGTYTVTATTGGFSTTATAVVAPSTGFEIGAATVLNECDGGANGAIALDNVIGSTVVYNWSNGAVTKNITGLLAGTYTVTATSTANCTLTSTFVIGAFNTPVLTAAVTPTTCGLNNGSITVTSNIPGVIINWVFQPSTPTRSNLAPGTYQYFSNSNGGCASPVTDAIVQPSTNTATVTLPTSPTLYLGQSTILVATGSNGGIPGGGLYLWSTAETGSAITVAPTANTTYSVTFTDASSCTASASVNVIVLKGEYEIPNFFTPNGDGANDDFSFVSNEGNGIKLLKIQIFNRWGELVHDANTAWDGNYKGAPQVMDTYVYIMTVKMPDGKEETKYGDIFLIR
jgi:gliding motility-associated-like protein